MRTTASVAQAGKAWGVLCVAWFFFLALEAVAVSVREVASLAGGWDFFAIFSLVLPLALVVFAPAAWVAWTLSSLARHAASERSSRRSAQGLLLLVGLCAGLLLAYGTSLGRHFARWEVRSVWLFGGGSIGLMAGFVLPPLLVKQVNVYPLRTAWGAWILAVCGWSADLLLLPKLYPVFHGALAVLTLGSVAVGAAGVCSWLSARTLQRMAQVGLVGLLCACVWAWPASKRLQMHAGVRFVLLEHAPLLGRAVQCVSALQPDPVTRIPWAEGPIPVIPPVTGLPALDWRGRDLVLITVDALRADHLSAYGYARTTTPHLDRLAAEGALFSSAYCASPHTSYSLVSLLTGKPMFPLVRFGLGGDSHTWPAYLQRYAYRTAAFYPPAVFFVDGEKFPTFRDQGFDFEYKKVEFADPALRVEQVQTYLDQTPAGHPLFLWVHLFEPHEPYTMHSEHPFGDPSAPRDLDRYDSEIAAADVGIGQLIDLVRARRKNPVFVVTADHGEAFGEHGTRYHGTTVYEEQVRVPLVVVGPGVKPSRIDTVVQLIDVLPTVLSALRIPPSPRIQGRDLTLLLAHPEQASQDPGFAVADTEDYTLTARGGGRLVCLRRLDVCRLYHTGEDPGELHDVSSRDPEAVRELQALAAQTARNYGLFEGAMEWPEAIRRGIQGDTASALPVAALLQDSSVRIRRKAAELCLQMRVPATASAVAQALSHETDDLTRRFLVLAQVRMQGEILPLAEALLQDPDPSWRHKAALAFAAQGDPRATPELIRWWQEEGPPRETSDVQTAKKVLQALVQVRVQHAAALLVPALDDLRVRPEVAKALGELGDSAARTPLLAAFVQEPYPTMRIPEGRALIQLGVKRALLAPLLRWAGGPDGMDDAVLLAREAGLLQSDQGGWFSSREQGVNRLQIQLRIPSEPLPLRLFVLTPTSDPVEGTLFIQGKAPTALRTAKNLLVGEFPPANQERVTVLVRVPSGFTGLWLVPVRSGVQ